MLGQGRDQKERGELNGFEGRKIEKSKMSKEKKKRRRRRKGGKQGREGVKPGWHQLRSRLSGKNDT